MIPAISDEDPQYGAASEAYWRADRRLWFELLHARGPLVSYRDGVCVTGRDEAATLLRSERAAKANAPVRAHRQLLAPAFSRKVVDEVAPELRRHAAGLLDAVADAGEVEVCGLASAFHARSLLVFLGFPVSEGDWLARTLNGIYSDPAARQGLFDFVSTHFRSGRIAELCAGADPDELLAAHTLPTFRGRREQPPPR